MEILWRSERRRAKAVGAYEAVTVTQKGSNMKHKPSVWHCHVSQLYKEHEALYAFGICCLNIFFFLHSSSSRFPLLLTLEVSNCLKEPNPVPLSGNSLDTSIRQGGRADAWNFNQKENNEFVEFENASQTKCSQPSLIWKSYHSPLPPS